jgi:hypothetical protein
MSGDVLRWKIFFATFIRETLFLLIRNKNRCTFYTLTVVLDCDDLLYEGWDKRSGPCTATFSDLLCFCCDDLFPNMFNKGNTLHDLELNGNDSCATSCPFISLMHVCWLASVQLLVLLHHWFRDIFSLNFVTNNCFLKRRKKKRFTENVVLMHFVLPNISARRNLWSVSWVLWSCFVIYVRAEFQYSNIHDTGHAWLHCSRQDRFAGRPLSSRRAGHLECMQITRNSYTVFLESIIRRELGTDEKVILKQILEKYVIKMWIGMTWLWMGSHGSLNRVSDESLSFMTAREFFVSSDWIVFPVLNWW